MLMSLIQNGTISLANLGDSCGFILKDNGTMRKVTVDQTPSRPDENERIVNKNGFVQMRGDVARVDGCLAVSRAIGDKNLKQFIISEPEVHHHKI